MKIVRVNELPEEDRSGYCIKRLLTEPLTHNPENIGFFRTIIPADQKVKNHLHPIALEIIIFLNHAVIKDKEGTHRFSPGDMAILEPGEEHEILAGGDGKTEMIAIRIPNYADDKQVCD